MYLKLDGRITISQVASSPDGVYMVDTMIGTIVSGIVTYIPTPIGGYVIVDDIVTPTPEIKGTVSESFALKIAAMAFERDTIPKL